MTVKNDLCLNCNGKGFLLSHHNAHTCDECNGTGIASNWQARRAAIVLYCAFIAVIAVIVAWLNG